MQEGDCIVDTNVTSKKGIVGAIVALVLFCSLLALLAVRSFTNVTGKAYVYEELPAALEAKWPLEGGSPHSIRLEFQQNDILIPGETDPSHKQMPGFKTNNSGGIQGGISNGQDIYFRVAFKPVATLLIEQDTVDIHGNAVKLKARGRHDACVLPRAVPIVEAMAAMVILDSMKLAGMI